LSIDILYLAQRLSKNQNGIHTVTGQQQWQRRPALEDKWGREGGEHLPLLSQLDRYAPLPPVPHSQLTPPGYFRIVLAIASLYYMPLHPRTCSLLYSISCLLDALDGLAARHFQQSTKFGAVLDMVTDRCTTACLLVFLASAFPRWSIVFQGLISLDLASHYMHMYATLSMGGSGQSHKKVDESRSWVLKMYYSNNVRCTTPSIHTGRQAKRSRAWSWSCFWFRFANAQYADPATESPFHLLRPQ
jgi:hypothetical protein